MGGFAPTSRTVEAILAEAADDRSSDFLELFRREESYVQRTLRRLGVSPMDVEDLAHEVFLRVHGSLSSLDRSRPVRPWLFAFCFRVAGNYRRRRREAPDPDIEPADPRPSCEELIEREQDRRLVLRALDVLSLEQRAVFVLHCLDEVPVPEVSKTLGVPLGTAYTRLRAARKSFAEEVRRIQGLESP